MAMGMNWGSRRGRSCGRNILPRLLSFLWEQPIRCVRPQRSWIWQLVLIAMGLFSCDLINGVAAQSRPPTEYEIKAAFLYEFGRFVEWPAASRQGGDSFSICVLGEDPFGLVLDEAVQGKTILGATVAAKRIVGVTDAGTCRILFISPSEENRLLEILRALEGRSVLTVGEGNLFTRRGGMISFTIEDKRVRFSINLAATEREGLRMSSRLLRVARVVEAGRGGT